MHLWGNKAWKSAQCGPSLTYILILSPLRHSSLSFVKKKSCTSHMIRMARLRQMAYGMWLGQWHCSLDIIPKHWHPLQHPFLSSLYDRPHLCVLSPVILLPLTKDHDWYYPLSLLVIIHSNRARRCHFRCSRCRLSVHICCTACLTHAAVFGCSSFIGFRGRPKCQTHTKDFQPCVQLSFILKHQCSLQLLTR